MDKRAMLRKQLIKRANTKIVEKMAGKEVHIIKAVNLTKDLEAISNLMKENIADWRMKMPSGDAQGMFTELEKNALSIDEERKKLITFIDAEMRKEFPNFTVLATPIIGARLLSQAGSKERLCMMPSSTIQVLGAEKALFKHRRERAMCPKHGHIFNHPLMQKLPKMKRGKAARIIAGSLSRALRIDYFKGADISKEMLKEMETKINKL